MRSPGAIGANIGMIAVAAILLSGAAGELAGQPEYRPYSVRGSTPTPERLAEVEWQRALLMEGWKVTPAEAARFEGELAKDSENLTLRLRLMSYYMQQVMLEKYVVHAVWLIEHQPGADALHGSDMTTRIPAYGSDGQLAQTRLRALWKEQANRHSRDARVLRNAANAVSAAEPALALQYVKASREAEPGNAEWTTWLAKTYADAIRWTYWDGKSMMEFTGDAPDYRNFPLMLPLTMCQEVKKELEASTDAALLGAVGEMLVRQARMIEADSITPDVEQSAQFGEGLLRRARLLH